MDPLAQEPQPAAPAAVPAPILPGALELARQTLARFKEYYARLAGLLIVIAAASVLFTLISRIDNPLLILIAGLVAAIAYSAAYIGVIRVISNLDGADVTTQDTLSRSLKQILPYIWVSIIIGLVTFGGLVLLIVPGVILGVFLSQALYIVIIEDARGMKALRRSWSYVKERWWAVFGRIILMTLVIVAASIVFNILLAAVGIGSVMSGHTDAPLAAKIADNLFQAFFTTPFMASFLYLLYSSLRTFKAQTVGTEAEEAPRTWINVFLVIGIIALILIPIILGAFFAGFISALLKAGAIKAGQPATVITPFM